jgi:spore coat protein U-like protein
VVSVISYNEEGVACHPFFLRGSFYMKLALLGLIIFLLLLMTGICYCASTTTLAVTATVISKNQCKFKSSPGPLNFGTLNPANPVDVTATTTVDVSCGGSSGTAIFYITGNGGLYGNKMRNTTYPAYYLPYTFNNTSGTITKVPGSVIVTLSGVVKGTDYENAYVGNYSDTVTLTLSP